MMLRRSALLLALLTSTRAAAQDPVGGGETEPRAATATVFARYADRILKIQVVETGSAAKASIGTGFFVSDDGLMLTNFHVISERIHEPATHRVEVVLEDGTAHESEVIALDVVHDLAVLRTPLRPARHFTLDAATVPQGARLYSLGHPSDLGLSIVEGTYNGNLKHTLYPKIHFTGSINPGMSGGPTITADGRVIGVNVSTMGEQRSFLVPRADAAALLARAQAPGYAPPADPLAEMAKQLSAYQDAYLTGLFGESVKQVEVGRFRVPTEPSPIFRCWGGADRSTEGRPYEYVWHSCSTDDDVFIAGEHSSGMVELEHQVITANDLNAVRFAALYQQRFARDDAPGGDERHVTPWRCQTRNVKQSAATVRAVVCLRKLRKLEGLYDGYVKAAALGANDTGLISTVTIGGASFANIDRIATRFLELVAWR